MSKAFNRKSVNENLPPESAPWCLFCGKPVESVSVTQDSQHSDMVVIQYRCHEESAEQTLPASVLESERGLAGYTAFNDYTSGLLPRH